MRVGASLLILLASASACGDFDTVRRSSPVIYGRDDRIELFEATPPTAALVSQAMVALIPTAYLRRTAEGSVVDAATWGDRETLCASERFADQPSAAFCSGVLVDWNLVLTAGHCVRVLSSDDYVVAFGYYYKAPGVLLVGEDIAHVIEIVDERLDEPGAEPRLDYAWLRLDHAARSPRRPAPVYLGEPALAGGDPLVSIGTGGGIPMKVDLGGKMVDRRTERGDYFVATTDTAHGSSGGGAFDPSLSLLGVLARGEPDLATTEEGCNQTLHATADREGYGTAGEQFTYASAAVKALCEAAPTASSLCRSDCGAHCEALDRQAPELATGCAVGAPEQLGRRRPGVPFSLLGPVALLLCTAARGRKRRSSGRSCEAESTSGRGRLVL